MSSRDLSTSEIKDIESANKFTCIENLFDLLATMLYMYFIACDRFVRLLNAEESVLM